jgi:GxxExxY protein
MSVSYEIVGAAIEVHKSLGLSQELRFRGISYRAQVPLPLRYRTLDVECGYRLDFVVDDSVIVEVKAVRRVQPVHRAQVLTYLKLTEIRLGLLINFNVEVLRSGIYRVING